MDRRDLQQHTDAKQEVSSGGYDDRILIDGKSYRVPYKTVREIIFSNVRKEDLVDTEHAARLQYRIMLLDPVLRAKVEYVKQRISITYNPTDADNMKEKISLDELMDFLGKEGVYVGALQREERDVDYVKEIYSYQYNPAVIREHAPYGLTLEEWKKAKPKYIEMERKAKERSLGEFREFQAEYAQEYPEIFGKSTAPAKKKTFLSRIFGTKKAAEKKFWFRGV